MSRLEADREGAVLGDSCWRILLDGACRGRALLGGTRGSNRLRGSLGHLHAYQTISEVPAISIAPKNR